MLCHLRVRPEAHRRHGPLGLNVPAGSEAVSRMVFSCGQVMESCLEKNGETACKALRTFCTNKEAVKCLARGDALVEVQKKAKQVYAVLSMEVIGPM